MIMAPRFTLFLAGRLTRRSIKIRPEAVGVLGGRGAGREHRRHQKEESSLLAKIFNWGDANRRRDPRRHDHWRLDRPFLKHRAAVCSDPWTMRSLRDDMWGLSQGLTMLRTAGGFWFLYGIFRGTSMVARGLPAILTVCAAGVIGVATLPAGAIRLRRIAHFSAAILRASAERNDARRELRQYAVLNLLQWIALAGVGI